jgi:hypothetical protein
VKQRKRESVMARRASAARARNTYVRQAEERRTNADLFCFICMITGLGFRTLEIVCAFLNLRAPRSSLFYKAQERVAVELTDLAYRSTARKRQLVLVTHNLAFDGSWEHVRWSLQCFAGLIDIDLRWIVDFDVIDGPSGDDRALKCAQTLESQCLDRLSKRWCGYRGIGFTHDQDSKAMKILAEHRWIVRERFDRNHVMRSYYKLWKEYAFILPKGRKRRRRVLGRWIELSLVKHFQFVAKMEGDWPTRLAKWRGAVKHFRESRWPDKGDPLALQQLKAFVEKTEPLLERYQAGCSTRLNESLHAMRAKTAPKQYI